MGAEGADVLVATIRVYRFDPEGDKEPRYDEYDVDVAPGRTVLNLLHDVHYGVDPTLSFRRSCQSAICGSCAMNVNGRTGLTCSMQAKPLLDRDGYLVVEPMKNMPVLKDLVVDMGTFWDSVHDVDPFLQAGRKVPKGAYVVPKAKMDLLKIAQDCIMCGSCLSECTSREANPDYLGPAALAKAYRFVADERDESRFGRLMAYSEANGIWDCDTCLYCNEVCPIHVKPMDAIMRMREMAIEAGIESQGSKHAIAFYNTILKSGKLNEFATANKSLGLRGMVRQSDVAAKVVLRMKTPEIRKKPIEGIKDVTKLANLIERKRQRRARR
jgi:succinate dehydrogenase / fumarate reductase iron-sulfur subunit